jgi:hypothetical protein
LIETQFPNYSLPSEIQSVLECWEEIRLLVDADPIDIAHFVEKQLAWVAQVQQNSVDFPRF